MPTELTVHRRANWCHNNATKDQNYRASVRKTVQNQCCICCASPRLLKPFKTCYNNLGSTPETSPADKWRNYSTNTTEQAYRGSISSIQKNISWKY